MSDAHGHSPSEPRSDGPVAVPPDYRPRKVAEILELDMGDGFILYNHDSSLVHHLNPSAAILWQLCDGDASVEQLSVEVAEEYGLDKSQVLSEISELIAELDALALVEDAGAARANG